MSNRIKELRKELSLSQYHLGYEVGISQQNISRYENNINTLPVDMLVRFSDFFKVSTDYILGVTAIKCTTSAFTQSSNRFTQDITQLVRDYTNLSPSEQKIILELIDTFKKN